MLLMQSSTSLPEPNSMEACVEEERSNKADKRNTERGI
jgi:hypothetical protein